MKTENKNIRLLVSSRTISKIGDVMFDFANNTFLAGINPNSLFLVGIYQSLESLIGIFLNLFGGVVADSFDRKRIVIVTDFLSGIACILLSFISNEKWLIYAIVIANIILAIMNSFSGPAYKAVTKEIVGDEQISRLNSFLETSSTIVKVTVPIIAVVLYKILSVHGVLLLDGISFLIAALMVRFITPVNEDLAVKDKTTVRSIVNDMFLGFKYIFDHKQISLVILLSALVNFMLAAYNLLLPYSNQMFSGLPKGMYGLFLTAEAIGGLLGALASGFLNKQMSSVWLTYILAGSGFALALAPILYFYCPNQIIISLSPALFNLLLTIFNIQFFSIVQREVDNQFLGRVFGIVFTVAVLFMPIGTWIFSIVLQPKNSLNFLFVGLMISALSVLFAILFKKYAGEK
ncbi:MFS transporter [Lactobacillus delbrueckii]|uniref:MFS transporter n=1 Tax=Lactobacillus delbrueckii TaxID=1584 RepID=UPI003994F66D